eukprot:1161868-Pelagomonas_calceolata.AAC.9
MVKHFMGITGRKHGSAHRKQVPHLLMKPPGTQRKHSIDDNMLRTKVHFQNLLSQILALLGWGLQGEPKMVESLCRDEANKGSSKWWDHHAVITLQKKKVL